MEKLKCEKKVVDRLARHGPPKKATSKMSDDKATSLSEKQVKALITTFRKIDVKNEGRIHHRDLHTACKKLGILLSREEFDDIIVEAESSGKGYIDYRMFERVLGHQLQIANFKNKHLMGAFKKFDKDGDGFITGDEIKQVFKENGLELDEQQVEELIEEADADKDGTISFEEFVHSVYEKDW